VHYYELHEGDDNVFSDLILAREEEMDAEDFFSLVQDIRRRVQDAFETDTLIADDRLTAAVNVSPKDTENFLADLDEDAAPADEDGFRTIVADFDPDQLERN
jgi:predicted ATPase